MTNTSHRTPLPSGSNRYGATAARPEGVLRAPLPAGITTIDMHSHVAAPEAQALVAHAFDPMTMPLVRFSTPETRALNLKQDGDRRELMLDVDKRLAEMARYGIAHQVIMPTPFQCYYSLADAGLAADASRAVNEAVARFRDAAPGRFTALGTVPLAEPAAAVDELAWLMAAGFRGAQILTNVNGLELSAPRFEPFWAAAERLGAVILLHPNGFSEGERLSRFYFNNTIGNPFDTTIALHYLVFDGVLERYPALKLIAVHGGGYVAAYSGRMDHAWGARSDCRSSLPLPPSEYLKRIYFDSVVFTTHQLHALVDLVGADHVMMGTDYPYDMAEYDPVGHVLESGFEEATSRALLGDTARRLFRIG
ncbi:MAG: amidohydrolase [Mesorhizobium sp.]|nr:amidohydrolase family protein [Mesorhizobium sp.]MCO5160231.1 amidohydrolase [Mesorhizobium sp.]